MNDGVILAIDQGTTGVPVEVPRVTETTALGAACLAGLATGFCRDREELAAQWQLARRFEPRLDAGERRRLTSRWLRAVERTRRWDHQPE